MLLKADRNSIAAASELLRKGELVAFPTETVYGLGADATNAQAVLSIFSAQDNRPRSAWGLKNPDAPGFFNFCPGRKLSGPSERL